MIKLLILLLVITCNAYAGNFDGTIWEGVGNKTTQTTTTATITVKEYGNVALHRSVIKFTASPVVLTLDGTTDVYGGIGITTTTAVYTFPKGAIQIIGADCRGSLTLGTTGTITTAYTGVTALGTVTAPAGATLTGTAANILASSAYTASGLVAPIKGYSLVNITPYDGTGTAMPLFLNFSVAYVATDTSGTGTYTGTCTVTWSNLTNN